MNQCTHSLKLSIWEFILLYGFRIERTRSISKVRFECKECGKSFRIKWKLAPNHHYVFSIVPVILLIALIIAFGILAWKHWLNERVVVYLFPLVLFIGYISEYLVSMELIKLFTERGIIAEMAEIDEDNQKDLLSKEEAVFQSKKSREWITAGVCLITVLIIVILLELLVSRGR